MKQRGVVNAAAAGFKLQIVFTIENLFVEVISDRADWLLSFLVLLTILVQELLTLLILVYEAVCLVRGRFHQPLLKQVWDSVWVFGGRVAKLLLLPSIVLVSWKLLDVITLIFVIRVRILEGCRDWCVGWGTTNIGIESLAPFRLHVLDRVERGCLHLGLTVVCWVVGVIVIVTAFLHLRLKIALHNLVWSYLGTTCPKITGSKLCMCNITWVLLSIVLRIHEIFNRTASSANLMWQRRASPAIRKWEVIYPCILGIYGSRLSILEGTTRLLIVIFIIEFYVLGIRVVLVRDHVLLSKEE